MVDESALTAAFSHFARTVIDDYPVQKILDHLVESIVEILPVTSAGVTVIAPGQPPPFVASSDDDALHCERLQVDLGEGPCIETYQRGVTVSIPDLENDARFPHYAPAALAGGLRAVFTFPLEHKQGRLGALDLYRDTPGDLDTRDVEAAQALADVATAYLRNAENRAEALRVSEVFRHGALHDGLTGLPNRVLFFQRLTHAAARAKRQLRVDAILFVDLDDFKGVNDTYGHHLGDELLIAVAHRFGEILRSGDTLARIAGDEFIFLCEDLSSTADVDVVAARITACFDEPFVLENSTIRVTASIGVAFAGPGTELSADLMREADRAMYAAKRNRDHLDHNATIDLREARTNPRAGA